MISVQYNFTENNDSAVIRDRLVQELSKYFEMQIEPHDPVASRMQKIQKLMTKNSGLRMSSELLDSEIRLARRLGTGYLLRGQLPVGVINFKISTICVQVYSQADLPEIVISQIRDSLTKVTEGDFE